MCSSQALLVIVVVVLFFIVITVLNRPSQPEGHRIGDKAMKQLTELLESGQDIPEISKDELKRISDRIAMVVKAPSQTSSDPSREGMDFFQENDTRMWQRYYYAFPYNHKYGGAWPPNMFSRLTYLSPGFYTTGNGLSYQMRPGMGYKWWPRNRWVRSKGDYYLLVSDADYVHDAADYSNPAFAFI